MDWWQAGSVMGTVVLATTAVVTISWRVLAGMRQENRAAHDKIGEKITQVRTEVAQVRDGLGTEVAQVRDGLGTEVAQVRDGLGAEIAQLRDGLGAEIAQLRDGLGAEIAQLRDGQAAMREGIGEIRGELRGVRHSLETLRGDFRAHVFGQQD